MRTNLRWEHWIIGIAIFIIAFLFALNGRYKVVANSAVAWNESGVGIHLGDRL